MRDNSRHISLCLEMLSVVRIMFFGTFGVVVEEDHIQEHKKDRGVLVKLHVVVFILLHSSYIHGSLYRYITPFGYDCISVSKNSLSPMISTSKHSESLFIGKLELSPLYKKE